MKHKCACAMRVQWAVQKLCFTDSGMRSDDGTAKWKKVVSFQTAQSALPATSMQTQTVTAVPEDLYSHCATAEDAPHHLKHSISTLSFVAYLL